MGKERIAKVDISYVLGCEEFLDASSCGEEVIDSEEDYQMELQGDAQEDKLTTAMVLLARAITQKFSTPTNNRLHTSSNTRNQAVINDVELIYKPRMLAILGMIDESNQIVQHVPRTESNLGRANVQYYNCNAKGTLNEEENDFMPDNAYGYETLEELTTIVIIMTRIQPENDNAETEPKYDAKAVSELIQTIYMLGKRPNKVYDLFLKARLGYQSLERLKKDIAAQPKMYDGERLHSTKLIIDSPDYEETLKDAEKSRLKMKNKIIQLNYAKLNALYETFIPQKEFFAEQTYFSTPFTSNVSFESSKKILDLPTPKMPNESKLLKMFDKIDEEILAL
nr:hypothetical protein [Tanacetum cinerariifolium]